jgi:multidrug resistance efflux pump
MKRIRGTSYQSGRLRRHFLPVMIWSGALAGIVFMFQQRSRSFEVVGFAQGQMRQIASTRTGQIKKIWVELYKEVGKGQIVAELNDEQYQAQLASAHAEISQIRSQLTAAENKLRVDIHTQENNQKVSMRTFTYDVERINVRLLDLKAGLETDLLMLKNVESEMTNVEKLVKQNSLSEYDLEQVKSRHDLLVKKIESTQELIKVAKQDLDQAVQSREEYAKAEMIHPDIEKTLAPLQQAIEVQQQRIKELEIEGKALVLHSPLNGIISQILCRPGETVMPGEPIITIAEKEPTLIVAYLPESRVNNIPKTVEIIKSSNPPRIARSSIIRIGPSVETKPEMYWRNPNVPERGRACVIAVSPELELIPGERVGIRGL